MGVETRSGVIENGAGDMTTRGPVHLERLDTTSARSDRSENSTFGCYLSWRHASLHGIMSGATGTESGSAGTVMDVEGVSEQLSHGAEVDSLTASQKAFPKSSDEHASQFDGSPEQFGGGGLAETGKIEIRVRPEERRRSGTGGLYAGRLSSMEVVSFFIE